MNTYSIAFAVIYLGLKLLVRWVWFRSDTDRPAFLRHFFTIRALDFAAVLALCATFFFILIHTNNIVLGIGVIAGMIFYDITIRWMFLIIEARRICRRSDRHDMRSAIRRLRRRAQQETPF